MNVNFGGRTYSFEVQPGPDGYRRFTSAIRAAFALPDDSELNITFTCDEPNTGEPPRRQTMVHVSQFTNCTYGKCLRFYLFVSFLSF